MIFSINEFNNLKPADKLRKLNEQLKDNKQDLGMEDFKRIFPGIEKQ